MDDSYWWSLYGMWAWMGPITKATVVLMALMLLCATYNFLGQIERNHAAGIATVSALEILHRCAALNEVISSIETLDDKLSSPIVLAGLEAFKTAPDGFAEARPIELAKRAMDRREALAHLEARRRLILLDTVASVAPMLGMFATILALLGALSWNAECRRCRQSSTPSTQPVTRLCPLQSGWPWRHPLLCFSATYHAESKNSTHETTNWSWQVRRVSENPAEGDVIESVYPMRVRARNVPHNGNRLLLCAVWLWWLYLAGLLVAGAFAG